MSNEKMNVTKTLIIGLGSTGTEICDMIAERIEWELGGLSKAPWVRMLGIETQSSKQSVLRNSNDFISIEIPPREFSAIIEHPEKYDEKIDLSKWVDTETLEKLPNRNFAEGAGNIRMVGRLAFLYQDNYTKIYNAVSDRIHELRSLSTSAAMEKRGPMPDGTNPEVDFTVSLRVVAVGTLCGGTCSGVASDFGYFLKLICSDDEQRIAFFTLPHPGISTSTFENANRYKRNAYHALIELNHYHLSGKGKVPEIKFWDGKTISEESFPWDIPYLAMPRGSDQESVKELHRAVADRVFLYVFVPETQPNSKLVDATNKISDLYRRAHVFCSFGLATIEFPAQQVTEACGKHLLSFALKEWKNHSLSESEAAARLGEIGLGSWSQFRDLLLVNRAGESIQKSVSQKRNEITKLAEHNAIDATKNLEQFRLAFSTNSSSPADQELAPGYIPRCVQARKQLVAKQLISNLASHVRVRLLDYNEGPGPIRGVLDAARKALQAFRQARPPSYEKEVQETDLLLRRIKSYQASFLLRSMGLLNKAVNGVMPRLRQALERETELRLELEAWKALHTLPGSDDAGSGAIDRIERLLGPVERRIRNLEERIDALTNRLDQRYDELARSSPRINGICIFEEQTGPINGTVSDEYEHWLVSQDPSETTERMKRKYGREIIAAWTDLPNLVVPDADLDDDVLLKDFNPNTSQVPLPLGDMEAVARRPFIRLAGVDVLSRWQSRENADVEARDAVKMANPFLDVDRSLAESGGRSPINTKYSLLSPRSRFKEQFRAVVRAEYTKSLDEIDCPDMFRIIMLQEWYRFPLSGAPDILGGSGLCKAECGDFPMFFTRKDVGWVGISDEDARRIREAENLVIVMVLLRTLEPKGGALELSWPKQHGGDSGVRRLHLDIQAAVTMLAMEDKDMDGLNLSGAFSRAKNLVEEKLSSYGDTEESRAQRFVDILLENLESGVGSEVAGWNKSSVGEQIARYCSFNQALNNAHLAKFPPDDAQIAALRKKKGDPKPGGGEFEKDGFYCPECGGRIGGDENECRRNGWRCYVNPEHVFVKEWCQ